MSYIYEKVIFDSFPGIGNVIVSDFVRAVSYLHSRDIIHRDTIPPNVLVSNFHYKRYKYEESEMIFGKKPIVCKLGDFGKRDLYVNRQAL